MAKLQSSPIAKAARLLDLVPYISTHQGISVKDLAQEFDVSTTELLDDLNTLDVWTAWLYPARTY